jgi:hypothetical protein
MHLGILLLFAVGANFDPENLKGVANMRVIVESIPGADSIGLDADFVQNDVESNLRKAGLETSRLPGILPYVYLQINVLPLPNNCAAYSIHLSLKTGADIVGTMKLVMADLWSDGVLSARCKTAKKGKTDAELVKVIREGVVSETKKMVHDILAANQT